MVHTSLFCAHATGSEIHGPAYEILKSTAMLTDGVGAGWMLSRRTGFLWGQGIGAGVLALVRCRLNDPMGALRIMRESAAAIRAHGGLHGVTGVLLIVACAWATAGDRWRGARLIGAAEAAMAQAEGTPEPALARWAVEMTTPARAALGEERWARSAGRRPLRRAGSYY